MKFLYVSCIFLLLVVAIYGLPSNYGSGTSVSQPKAGAPVDEVVVESSLYIKKKPQIRRTRDVNNLLPIQISGTRVKRQHRGRRPGQVGSSQSAANAAANSNFFGPQGFGASAANAQAQGFRSQGPLGGFGASAANTQTQSFTAGRNGIQGAAGASTSQVYNLPNVAIYGLPSNYGSGTSVSQPKAGAPVDEVVVESSLYIKKKPQIRRTRDVNNLLPIQISGTRVKRQHRGRRPGQVGSSQSAANAAANSNFFGPQGFGASAANAQAQGFRSQGPLGGFGASAANTQTQSFAAGRNGIQGAAGASTSQVYNLPNGKTVNVAFSNGFSAGPNGISGSNAN